MKQFLNKSIYGLFVSILLVSTWAIAQTTPMKSSGLTEPQKRMELMKSKGPNASLTILPVRLAGKPWDRVTEVVGLLLEQQGLKNIELSKTAFDPTTKTDLQGLATSAGEFVKGHPPTTEYVLYAEMNGTHESGLNELRAVVVDKSGEIIWTFLQTPLDKELREPMSLCVFLVQQLSPQLGLNEETAKMAKPGKMAAIMDERSGLPSQNERSPLLERQKKMKESRNTATLMVFPVRIEGVANTASAGNLTKMINDTKLCKAITAKESLLLKASKADPNELKILWNLAREFRDYSKKNPPDADYILYADYAFNPQNWEQGFVHFVVCDRNGDWVIVDMQNSHQSDYQNYKPISREDCDKLLIKRLESYLR